MHVNRIRAVTSALLCSAALIAGSPASFSARTGAADAAADCTQTSVGFPPLSDEGAVKYKGYVASLYPHGAASAPEKYLRLGKKRARRIAPRDTNGRKDPNGKIVLLSVGMSNTKAEFDEFRTLIEDSNAVAETVVAVNGAQGGQDAPKIDDPNAKYWKNIDGDLEAKRMTRDQVQVAWLKQAVGGETDSFPDDAKELQGYLQTIVEIMRDRFPNLKIVYLSSRIYAGYATTALNPEPHAYQSGYSVKWLIGKQIRSDHKERPWLAWGPYLWTDGLEGRDDGLTWTCEDVQDDGTHPSESGQLKVANLLLDFFKSSSTSRSWFLAD
jgi:hypothetical protein